MPRTQLSGADSLVQTPSPPVPSCVTLGGFCVLSVPSSSHVYNGDESMNHFIGV